MSLYGIKDITQIENKIVYSIIENRVISNSERKTLKILINVAKTYINSLGRRDSIMDFIKLFQEISKYIIIFDDLERCIILITELLGYINELVEHKNMKTILIANEEKMSKGESSYQNKVYFEIKEKLIGEVIYYNPNIERILKYICDEESNYLVSKVIENNKYKIIEVMQKFDYKNIRTLKICISKLKTIIEKMEEIKTLYKNYNEKIYNQLLDNIVIYLVYVVIMYKENIKLYDWNILLGSFGMINLNIGNDKIEILGFKFVDKLVRYSTIDRNDISEILNEYNKRNQNDIYGKNTPFGIIKNFFGKKDIEVQTALEEMKKEMKNNSYIIDVYSDILCYLLEMKYAAYDERIIQNIIDLMEYNIKNHSNKCITQFVLYSLGYGKEKKEYYNTIEKWKIYDREQVIENRKIETRNILKQKEWGMKFRKYCEDNKDEFEANKSFFSSIDYKELLYAIEMGDSKDVLETLRGINNVYDYRFILKTHKKLKDYYKDDINSILKFREGLIKIRKQYMEKGKRYIINELILTLDNWVKELI